MKEFTIQELAQCDGQNGRPSYFAYRGIVYDVSNSFLWKGGRHQVLHNAGRDLTEELQHAPHRPDLIKKVPVIGVLK